MRIALADVRTLAATAALLTASWAVAQGPQTLVIAQGVDIHGFDVHDHNQTAVEAVLVNLFDYLVFRSADGAFEPALATAWERIGDTAMRFELREGVVWHDGTPFTADDVKFSLERVARDTSLREHGNYMQIREVEVLSPLEVIVHTAEPDPVLLGRLSRIGSSIVPRAYLEAVGWEGFDDAPIGTGPFRFVEWRRDERLVLEAFDRHWRGRPAFDRLVHRVIPEDSTRVAELLTGGVHVATNVPAQDRVRVETAPGIRVEPWPTPRVMLFLMNTDAGVATGDRRVREAIEYAIDNRLLVDALMGGLGTPTRGRVSPGITAAPMRLFDTYLYDPERAIQLLAEAGYGPGELTIKVQGPAGRYPNDADIVEFTAVMLEAVGIRAEVEVLEWSAYLGRVWNADAVAHMGLIGLGNSLFDAALAYTLLFCDGGYSGKTNWCDPDFDTLLEQALVELDPERRADMYDTIYQRVADERVMVFLFQVDNLAGVSDRVAWTPRADELLWMFDARPADAR
jgi:peptide/nickel transport system substrate-binding protein